MDKKTADRLISQTRENYDNISESFSQTRNYLWPEMASLVMGSFKMGSRVLDIGCGNGRFYEFFKQKGVRYVGVDNSEKLIAAAKIKFPEADFRVADALCLPFEENEFDLAVSTAVLHHIPSKVYRRLFFKEARRVLKPGGCLVVEVWDLRLTSMIKSKQWKRLKIFAKSQIKIAAGLDKFDFGDFFIPWQNKYQRYVHGFTFSELKKLASGAGFQIYKTDIASLGSKEGNLYIVAKKCEKKM